MVDFFMIQQTNVLKDQHGAKYFCKISHLKEPIDV